MSTAVPPPAAPASRRAPVGSSKLKVIGLITAGSAVVGALGGIAGVAFDPEPTRQPPLISPAAGGGTLQPSSSDQSGEQSGGQSGGQSLGRTGRVGIAGGHAGLSAPELVTAPRPQITLSPSAGPNTGTGTDTTVPSPAPSTGGGSDSGGQAITLAASGVDIFLPAGWSVDDQEDGRVAFSDGQGNFAFAQTGTVDPSSSAGDLLSANLDGLLPPDAYTQRQVDPLSDLGAFGSVVSFSGTDYEALWVDNQGSATLHGQLYAAVRQDGTALVMEIEHIPAEDWDSAFDAVEPIAVNTYQRFGGIG